MKGYWQDRYVGLFCKSSERKSPEISRGRLVAFEQKTQVDRTLLTGYYARVASFRMLVEKFIRRTNRECQVINLGAGFDTLFWHLHSKSLCPKTYMEVDFASVVARKAHIIRYQLQYLSV